MRAFALPRPPSTRPLEFVGSRIGFGVRRGAGTAIRTTVSIFATDRGQFVFELRHATPKGNIERVLDCAYASELLPITRDYARAFRGLEGLCLAKAVADCLRGAAARSPEIAEACRRHA